MAAFHPRLKNERIQNYEELASYPFGPFGEKCVLYATFFMAVSDLSTLNYPWDTNLLKDLQFM
jgi:hypothetical protein